MDIEAESPNSGKVAASSKEKKLDRTVKGSLVLIVALGISLIALAAYTVVLVLTEYRSPQCFGTDFGVVVARNTSEVNNDNTVINKNTTIIEDTDFGVINARIASAFNYDNTFTKKKSTLIEDTDFGDVDARNASSVNKDNTVTKKNTTVIEDTAARILQNLNKDVDPCTDFYEFACGGWNKQNPVPAWSPSWDPMEKLQVQVFSDLSKLLEAQDDEGLPNSVMKAKSFYRTCMNITENLEADVKNTFHRVLQELGLPPRPPTNMSANFRWEEVAGRGRRQLGLDMLLSVRVAQDAENPSRNRLKVNQVYPWPEFLHFNNWEQYHKYIRFKISNAANEINAQQLADDVVKFSKQLYNITTAKDTGLVYDLSLQQLIEGPNGAPQWKQHDWDHYLKVVFSNTSVALQHQDKVYLCGLPYLQELSVLLANTEPVIIERYLWWMVYFKVNLIFELSRAISRQPASKARWITCTADVYEHFGHALSYLYVERHFDYTATQKAIEILENVRSTFAAAVQELDWMDSTTRLRIQNKVKAIKNLVGFPAWLLTPEQLDKYYEDTEVVEGNKFETYLKLTFAEVKKKLESLREKPDRNSWKKPATEVNASYWPIINSITVPAAILQPPFYGNGIEAIDYGSIGTTLGHEVTHGFDNTGRRLDEKGNLTEWWSEAAVEHYQSRAQCIIDQYNKYPMPQLPNHTVNGFNTLNENIADNGGLRAAFHAYQLFAKRAPAGSRVSLPGLTDYKPDQLFFLGFAQTWCGNATVGEHSPHKIRVIGTLSNSKEFADAWSCPAGSPMNPEHKCVLW